MSRTIQLGGLSASENLRLKNAMTRSDLAYRRRTGKKYFCAKCNEELTARDHVKFLFMCMRCAENGDAHFTQFGDKIYKTGDVAYA